jgi:hypothetical protein
MATTFQATTATYSVNSEGIAYLALADVNGDGKLDLLLVNDCGANGCTNFDISVLLGNGDGTFQTAINYSNGVSNSVTNWLALTDLNGDGKPDLVLANTDDLGDGTVSVLLGNGDGTFLPAAPYESGGTFANSVAAGDVNGDGIPDLVVADFCVDQACLMSGFGVLLGNGDGSFANAGTYYSGGQGSSSIGVADVNLDGKTDVLITNGCSFCGRPYQGNVGVLLNVMGDPFVELVPSALNFPSQPLNTPSVPQNVTLTNIGGSTLKVSNILAAGDFSQTNACPVNGLGTGMSCVIAVTFMPSNLGTRNGMLTITDNAPDSPHSVALSGVAQDFSISVLRRALQ